MPATTAHPLLWPRWWLANAAILFALAPVLPIVYGIADWPLTLGVAIVAFTFQPQLIRLLPESVDHRPRRRPVVTVLWLLLYLAGTAQLARLGAFHADPTRIWASTIPDPAMASHACMSAYVRAAELAAAGVPNIYAQVHWPVTNSEASRQSVVAGLGPALGDPFQYPPTFLLVFRAFDLFTRDYHLVRAAWFLLQVMVLLAIYGAVARWIGRPAERSLWLFPAFISAVPTCLDLQFGQVHLLAIATALMGRVLLERGQLERGKSAAGSLLLAAAIVTKLFPAVLLVELLARRRYREVAQVLAAAALLVTAGIAVLGVAPHADFLGYQVPRLLDGTAFSFFEEVDFFVSRNVSPFGIPLKLVRLGLADPALADEASRWFARGFALLLGALAWRFAKRQGGGGGQPLDLAIGWLALLSLGSLLSPLAPSAYVLASPLWMLALLAAKVRGGRQVALFVLAWLAILGPPPLPLPSPEFEVGLLLQLFAIALPAWLLWREPRTCLRAAPLPLAEPISAAEPEAVPAGG